MKLIDLTGKQYGRLSVLSRAEDHIQSNGRRRAMWLCECACGQRKIILGDNLKSGKVLSCGCLQLEIMHDKFATHHMTDTKIYGVWCAIKRRCHNPNTLHYEDYGGRGVTVCDEWKNSFESFYAWAIQAGYKEGLSIDRTDNDRGYCPENCRWVTAKDQANNRRSNRKYTYNGQTLNIQQWADLAGIPHTKLRQRLLAGWSIERAIETA